MKLKRKVLPVVVVMGLLLAWWPSSVAAVNGPSSASVNGSGIAIIGDENNNDIEIASAFDDGDTFRLDVSALKLPNAQYPQGTFLFVHRNAVGQLLGQFNGVVKCLYVGNGGSLAAVGGYIHQGTDPWGNNVAGRWVTITIRDNGRGQTGPPDEFGFKIAHVVNGGAQTSGNSVGTCYPGHTPFDVDQGGFVILGSAYLG